MKKKSLYLLLFIWTSCLTSWGQQYNFRRYSIEEQLPRAGVYEVMEDSNGYLWIGIEGGGVSRFDGSDFVTYTTQDGLCSNAIRSIYEDSFGNIWFGSDDNGVSRFDGQHFISINRQDGLNSNIIRSIVEDDMHNLWLATEGGGIDRFSLLSLTPDENKVIAPESISEITQEQGLASNFVRVLLKDKKGHIWVGADGGLSVFVNDRFINYTTQDGLPHRIVLSLYEDNKQNLWIGTEKGVSIFDGRTFKTITVDDGLIHNRVKSITQDKQGNMWFGTLDGLSKYDFEEFTNFTSNEGLSNSRIRSLFCDSFGNIWIATYFGGIMKYSGDLFTTYTEGLPSQQVTSIATDHNGEVWFGTWGGVSSYNKQVQSIVFSLAINGQLESSLVNHLFVDRLNRLWVSTGKGINIFQGEAYSELVQTLPITNTNVVIASDSTNIWAGTPTGLVHFQFSNFKELKLANTTFYTEEDGMNGLRVEALAVDGQGNIWAGFSDGGITVYSGTHYINLPSFANIKQVSSLRYHKGKMWIGTKDDGIYSYSIDKKGNVIDPPQHITKSDGLYSEQISLMLFDNKDKLWVGTKNGVSQISAGEKLGIKHFGYQEGFNGVETMDNAVAMDSMQNIWFGTIRGVIRLTHDSDLTDSIQSRTHLTNLKLGFRNINWDDIPYAKGKRQWVNLPEKLDLPYEQRNITFEFRGLSYRHPEKVKYRWILEGFDVSWSPESSINQATYGNLPPGEYIFKVISSNGDGVWNNSPETFSFTVKKPFWQTFSFYFLLIGTTVLVFVIGYQIKVYRLAQAKKLLEIEVETRTFELIHEKELALLRKNELEEKNVELQLRDQEVRSSLQYAHLIQSAILENDFHLKESFPNSFIIYQPKDIVSGDFYWFRKTKNSLFVAVADGTGHGVPGAFMSIVGYNALEQTFAENPHITPNQALKRIDEIIFRTLNSTRSKDKQPDGIDMALCKISLHHRMLEYAGAMRPLIIVRNGKNKFEKVGANRYGLGTLKKSHDYTNHTIITEAGDRLFLFSDGYTDQFGGPNGKKFLSKKFYNLLASSSDLPITTQKRKLLGELISWTGMEEQIDDIVVVGIEL